MRLSLIASLSLAAPSLWAGAVLPLANPGFEEETSGWVSSDADTNLGLSKVTTEAAHSGTAGLRVKQAEGGPGSWFQSVRTPVEADARYRIEFWARTVETSGIGVWVQFLADDRTEIKVPGQNQLAIQVPQSAPEWTAYHLDVQVPAGATSMTLAVHCYSKRPTLADFDDFSITQILAVEKQAPAVAAVAAPAAVTTPVLTPAPARVKEIASFLDARPRGIGASLDNRAAWNALKADTENSTRILARAGRYLNEAIPDVAEAYAASVRNGDRKADALVSQRRFRLATFVLAEGMENQGRFLGAIAQEIDAICTEESWILCGHVKFSNGRNDLGTAMTAWNLATAVTLLGDRLPAATQRTVRDEVRKRVLSHYLDAIRGKTKPEWWSYDANNWNAVVHGGIVGAALALDESVEERAEIIAAAEIGTQFYIRGFPADGYSTEGMGYWKYGFGHYVLMSEAVQAATHGKVSFYARDNIRLVAQFPRRFEITREVYPAYADAVFMEEPTSWLFHIIDRRYGLGDRSPRSVTMDSMFSSFLYAWGINLAFDSSTQPVAGLTGEVLPVHRLRDWFEQSQILVARLAEGQTGLGISVKGGNNGVSHGHNDVGTFVVVRNKQPLLVDPGATVYDASTFGPHRFENQVIGSYGHPVPVVAGQLQKQGSAYAAVVQAKDFTDAGDRLLLDLTKAYDVPSLRSLARRLDYLRAGHGSLTVTDRVEFSSPQSFGTALSTFGEATEDKPGTWTISQNGESVRVVITTGGLPFTVTNELLKNEARAGKVRRLGINLNAPVTTAVITLSITAP